MLLRTVLPQDAPATFLAMDIQKGKEVVLVAKDYERYQEKIKEFEDAINGVASFTPRELMRLAGVLFELCVDYGTEEQSSAILTVISGFSKLIPAEELESPEVQEVLLRLRLFADPGAMH